MDINWVFGAIFYLPVLLAVSVIFFIALRGRQTWSAPTCRRCRYDLRNLIPESTPHCPECGADLSRRRAVVFARASCRWSLMAIALLILLSPGIIIGGFAGYNTYRQRAQVQQGVVSPQSLRSMTIVEVRKAAIASFDQPWAWQELERRLAAGTLPPAEAQILIDDAIKHIAAHSSGWQGRMSWQNEFFKQVHAAKMMSDDQAKRFLEAYHGPLRAESVPRARQSDSYISFNIQWNQGWDPPLPYRLFNAAESVTLNGQPVEHEIPNAWRHGLNITLRGPLEPGKHTLLVKTHNAFIDTKLAAGLNDITPPADWPRPFHTWPRQIALPFTVHPDDAQLVSQVDDGALDPTAAITIESLVLQRAGEDRKVTLKLKCGTVNVPLSFDVAVTLGDATHALGGYWLQRIQEDGRVSTRSSGSSRSATIPAPADDIRTATVTLTPNAEYVDRISTITEIWGKPIVLNNVPVTRADVNGKPQQ